MINRRSFVTRLAKGLGVSMVWPASQSCQSSPRFKPTLTGPNFKLGHRLRTLDFGPVAEETATDIVIVGGGVAGLSAARYIKKFTNNFLLLELGEEVGGNAIAGKNAVSSFPLGAHYLPLPGNNDPELIHFLTESGVITGFISGVPVYNEYYLCFDPKERLYINNYWQEGIIPHEGVPLKDRDEIGRFMAMMHDFKYKKGSDGLDAFTIPLDQSSQDPSIIRLDGITMDEFLMEYNFTSPYLRWYVNYCCADDYGSTTSDTSAWAAIHYFASRKGSATNASSDTVLTWPEGNNWLVKQMKKKLDGHVKTNSLAYQISLNDQHVHVSYFDAQSNLTKRIKAKSIIMATPQFISQRLLQHVERPVDYSTFQYAPWMVANVTTDASLNEKHGEPLSWDNVVYGSNSLGYVNAAHQTLAHHQQEKVITYYQPLVGADASSLRKKAYETSVDQWSASVIADLRKPHPDIEHKIKDMEIWIWAHGMIKPVPGFVWSNNRIQANAVIKNRIHFAHSDLSGISIFEEAFYKGHTAAHAALQTI